MISVTGRRLALLVALSAIVTALMVLGAGERLAAGPGTALAIAIGVAAVGGVGWRCRHGRSERERIARDLAESVGLFTAICLVGAVASYPEAAASSGFVDPALERVDRLLGFDWVSWYAAVAAHPLLQWLGRAAYQAIFVSPALLLAGYAVAGRRQQARAFLASFWCAAVLTLLLFPSLPALGPLATEWHGPVPYLPTSALFQEQLIPPLRSHALTVIDLGALRGLVCAPSFHTASAILYAGFGWAERRLRWPLLALNGAMLLATPVEGTHYLADMLLGAAVAAAAIAATRLALRPWPQPVPARVLAVGKR